MKKQTRPIAVVILISLFALLGLGGCSLLRDNPVPPPPPPAPEVAFAQGDSNRYLSRQFERDNKRKIIGFKSLTKAEATVKQASEDAQAQNVAADEFALAQSNLEEAQATWNKIKAAPLSNPELLAQVDHKSYMASRWAQIALAESGVEVGLTDLVQVQQDLERQEEQARAKKRADNLWLGQQLVPEKFGSIRFSVGTARLTTDSQGVVNRLAAFMSEHPQYNLAIAGHTDSSPPSSRNLRAFLQQQPELASRSELAQASAYNKNVSQQRAAALAAEIVEAGINKQRISVEGFGQSRPIADNDSVAGRRKNRRVTATVVKAAASAGETSQSDLVQVPQNLERQEDRADSRWLGQQLIPEKFGNIRFSVGTARLTADSQGVVKRLAAFMSEHPQYNLEIAGHTDSSPPSSRNLRAFLQQQPELASRSESAQASAYNKNVSQKRAAALAAALVAEGISGQRLAVEGFGESRPIADNNSAAGRRKNRRVTATVVEADVSQASAPE